MQGLKKKSDMLLYTMRYFSLTLITARLLAFYGDICAYSHFCRRVF